MSKNGVTWKVYSLILLTDAMSSAAQLFMKKGVTAADTNILNPASVVHFLTVNIASPLMWLGIIIFTATFFIWIIVLTRVDLSVASPMASNDYVMIPILAMVFLKEIVSPLRWFGIFCIIAGIYCVSRSGKHGKQAAVEGTHA